jgi:hypothetical protein
MPIYECNEHQFVENLRRLIDTNFKIIVKRSIRLHDDAKHSVSRLPDCEFEKFSTVMARKRLGVNVYSTKPFYDLFHRRFYSEDAKVHSVRYPRSCTLSLPYFRVEYSFDIWGETYCYSLDALFRPEVRLERRKIRRPLNKERGRAVLVHVLDFKPPHPKTLELELPPSILVFDVNQKIRP